MNQLIGKEETYVQASINGYIIAKDYRVTIDSVMRYRTSSIDTYKYEWLLHMNNFGATN